MNLSEATKFVAILKGVYLREQFTEASPKSFLWLLEDLQYEAVLRAARIHGIRSKWCPTPAELREIIDESKAPNISTGEAWEVVQKQIRRHGYDAWENCLFGDEAILAAVKAVGWRRLCYDDNSQGYVRRDFDLALVRAQERSRKEIQTGSVDAISAPHLAALPRVP